MLRTDLFARSLRRDWCSNIVVLATNNFENGTHPPFELHLLPHSLRNVTFVMVAIEAMQINGSELRIPLYPHDVDDYVFLV